jgi:polar amino acid transport system substrate-binding protein
MAVDVQIERCPKSHLRRVVSFLFLLTLLVSQHAVAQTCGTDYILKEKDTLAQIATRVYGKASQWTIIFYANQDRLGTNASLMVPGLAIRIPCVAGTQQPVEPRPEMATAEVPTTPQRQTSIPLSTMFNRIEFLTADGDAPFTGRTMPNGGAITHILSAAMEIIKDESKGRFNYGISWVNDWSAHLSPLLVTKAFDVGYPWLKPDCDNLAGLDNESKFRCQRFFFSDPLQEVVTIAFARKDSGIDPSREDHIVGRSVCRPAKYGTFELDQGGRNWVKESKITLIRAQSAEECFRLLDSGTVEIVIASDLAGRAEIANLGIADRVRIGDRPIAIGTLHAVVAKTHPNGRTMLYYINSALAMLKESGEYDRVVGEHLQRFWESDPDATAPSQPSPRPTTPSSSPAGAREPMSGAVKEAAGAKN